MKKQKKLTYDDLNVLRQSLRASVSVAWTMHSLNLVNDNFKESIDTIDETQKKLKSVLEKIDNMINAELGLR